MAFARFAKRCSCGSSIDGEFRTGFVLDHLQESWATKHPPGPDHRELRRDEPAVDEAEQIRRHFELVKSGRPLGTPTTGDF